jgi:hypothetical protein
MVTGTQSTLIQGVELASAAVSEMLLPAVKQHVPAARGALALSFPQLPTLNPRWSSGCLHWYNNQGTMSAPRRPGAQPAAAAPGRKPFSIERLL